MRAGWKWLYNAPKWHYFRDGRSLCGRWMTLGTGDCEDVAPTGLRCLACQRKLDKEARCSRPSPSSRRT